MFKSHWTLTSSLASVCYYEMAKICPFFSIPTLYQIFLAWVTAITSILPTFFLSSTLLTLSSTTHHFCTRQTFPYLLDDLHWIPLAYHTSWLWGILKTGFTPPIWDISQHELHSRRLVSWLSPCVPSSFCLWVLCLDYWLSLKTHNLKCSPFMVTF